jgi:hypothetical protein
MRLWLFALPDPHNAGVVDLNHARRDADGRVRFSSDLNVLRPTDPTRGNGVLLFHVSNRGVLDLLGTFNRGNASDGGIGDGFLMRDGYTMVFVGGEFDNSSTTASTWTNATGVSSTRGGCTRQVPPGAPRSEESR